MAKASLESVGYQTRDLLEAMSADWEVIGMESILRVDGGMSSSDWAMQFLSDIIGAPVDRPAMLETTALGVAWLAGMHKGVYPDQEEFAAQWSQEIQFTPNMSEDQRQSKYLVWKKAVHAALSV